MKVFRFDSLNNLDFLPFFKLESFSGFILCGYVLAAGSVQFS